MLLFASKSFTTASAVGSAANWNASCTTVTCPNGTPVPTEICVPPPAGDTFAEYVPVRTTLVSGVAVEPAAIPPPVMEALGMTPLSKPVRKMGVLSAGQLPPPPPAVVIVVDVVLPLIVWGG